MAHNRWTMHVAPDRARGDERVEAGRAGPLASKTPESSASATLQGMDGGELLTSLAIGSVGYVVFAYGKRQGRFLEMMFGLVLLVFPYFVDGIWVMAGIATGLLALLFTLLKLGW